MFGYAGCLGVEIMYQKYLHSGDRTRDLFFKVCHSSVSHFIKKKLQMWWHDFYHRFSCFIMHPNLKKKIRIFLKPLFLCWVVFWPPKSKGSPLMMKNMTIVQRLHFIAQKKCPDALNATQKIPDPYKVWFLKKSRKTFFFFYYFGQKL